MSPRWSRVPLALALALASATAGCFGGDGGGEAPAAAAETEADANVSREVRPDGRGGTFLAFEETNRTEGGAGGLDHHHDYWQGRERATIFEGDVGMVTWLDSEGQRRTWADLPLTEDTLVYEGTASVELHFSNPQRRACEPLFNLDGELICTDYGTGVRLPDPEGGPAGLRVQLKHAAATDWIDAGEIAWDAPLVFAVTDPRMTDMPHSVATLWAFRVLSDDPAHGTLTFDARIDIVRAEGEIPLWPGHPEFYAETHEREVLVGTFTTREDGLGGFATVSTSEPDVAVPQKLISHGTRTLYVYLNITDVTTANPTSAPTGWQLSFHNATGEWEATDVNDPNHTGETREHVWILPVDDNGMDSPYSDGSRWEFILWGAFGIRAENPSGVTPVFVCGGFCAAYEVTYDLRIVATDLVAPEYSAMSPFT